MADLTNAEKKLLNNLSNVHDPNVDLGDIIQACSHADQTPVNAVAAAAVLTVSSIVIDGETFTIGDDVYEFLADVAQTKTAAANIGIDITDRVGFASRVLTIDTQPTSGNTMTIGSKVYTFVPDGTDNADGEITIGTDLASAKLAIVDAINGDDDHNDPHPLVSCGDFASNDVTITALIGGTAANSIATTETFTAETNVFAGATLAGGTNCSGANAITEIAAAITANTESLVSATADSGHVDILADVAGALANGIALAEAMANGSWDHAHMQGGVDGTVAPAGKLMFDTSYLYVCVDANTVADANWRRISVGSAY